MYLMISLEKVHDRVVSPESVPIYLKNCLNQPTLRALTVKILKFGTPQTIAIIVLKLVKFDVTLH